MIEVIFDFNNHIGTFKEGEKTFVRRIEIRDVSEWVKMASFAFTTNDGRRISASWKVWNNYEQFVILDELNITDKFDQKWYTVAEWSYIENPQPGTCQTSDVKEKCDGYSVIVVGSKYGDWMTI